VAALLGVHPKKSCLKLHSFAKLFLREQFYGRCYDS